MKILFCGLGSIGQKHLRNLIGILTGRCVPFTIDAQRTSRGALPNDIADALSNVYTGQDTLPTDYDVAFVTNPSSLHAHTLRLLGNHAKNFYIEKPVFTDPDTDISALGLPNSGVLYVACPLRHHPVLRKVKELVEQDRPFAARAICSSYLPDWRPAADYRTVYSAQKALGGGVSLDLIHEWDYLCWLFGIPGKVCGFSGKLSGLEIDSDDVAVYAADWGNLFLTLHLDYIGRPPERTLDLFWHAGTLHADLLNNTLTMPDKAILSYPAENIHALDVAYFIDCVLNHRADNMNTPSHAQNVLRVALLSAREVS